MIYLQNVMGFMALVKQLLCNSGTAMKITAVVVFLQVACSIGFKHDCHRNCFCIIWKELAVCSYQNLSRLPQNIPVQYTHMDVRNNNISTLLSGGLEKAALLHLKSLDMSFCNLHTVQTGAFHGMIRLVELNLNNNYIQTLDRNTFCGAIALAELSIASNLIHAVEPNAFCGINCLKMLNLNNNNISKLEEHMFMALNGLTALSLRGNNICHVPADIFVELKNLTFLDFSNNSISTITKASLSGLDKLLVLYLPNNSLICDCELMNTFRWLTEHNVSVTAACSAPKHIYGLPWQVMSNGGCNSAEIQDITTAIPDISVFQEPGTLYLPYALIVFAILTVILGVMIALYKHFTVDQQKLQQQLPTQRYRVSTQPSES